MRKMNPVREIGGIIALITLSSWAVAHWFGWRGSAGLLIGQILWFTINVPVERRWRQKHQALHNAFVEYCEKELERIRAEHGDGEEWKRGGSQ